MTPSRDNNENIALLGESYQDEIVQRLIQQLCWHWWHQPHAVDVTLWNGSQFYSLSEKWDPIWVSLNEFESLSMTWDPLWVSVCYCGMSWKLRILTSLVHPSLVILLKFGHFGQRYVFCFDCWLVQRWWQWCIPVAAAYRSVVLTNSFLVRIYLRPKCFWNWQRWLFWSGITTCA